MAFNKLTYLTNSNCHQTFQNILRTESDNNSFFRQNEYKLANFGNKPTSSEIWKKNCSDLYVQFKPNEKKHDFSNNLLLGTVEFNDKKKPVTYFDKF